MLKGVVLFVGVVLLALGGERLYYIFSNPEQVTMRCAEYAQSRSSALWLRLTDCEADYLGAGYRESGGEIVELFFPVRPAGRPRTEPAALVAATSDPDALAIAQATLGGGRQPDQEQLIVMMLKIITALQASREVEGWGRAGVFNTFDSRRSLASLSSPVEPDALVLDLHARPQATVPALAATAGAIALAGVLVLHIRSRRAAKHTGGAESAARADTVQHAETPEGAETVGQAGPGLERRTTAADHAEGGDRPKGTDQAGGTDRPERRLPGAAGFAGHDMDVEPDLRAFASDEAVPSPDASSLPAVGPPAAADVTAPARTSTAGGADAPRLRGLLLLRLPPSADTSEIENAPPLGARAAVMQRIAELLPDIRFDESGQGSVSGPGHLLVIDLGSEPLVHTAVARAEGEPAIDLLQALLVSAGWRAYSPRTATFIDAARLHASAAPPGDSTR